MINFSGFNPIIDNINDLNLKKVIAFASRKNNKHEMAYFAYTIDGLEIQLTQYTSMLLYPTDPLEYFEPYYGSIQMSKFMPVASYGGIVNMDHLKNFEFLTYYQNPKYSKLVANFKNGLQVKMADFKTRNKEKYRQTLNHNTVKYRAWKEANQVENF